MPVPYVPANRSPPASLERAHVRRDQAGVLLAPGLSAVGRAEDAAAEVRAREEVSVRVGREREDERRRQPVVGLGPLIAVVGRAEDARRRTSPAKRFPPTTMSALIAVPRGQALVDRLPVVAVVGRAEDPAAEVRAREEVTARVRRQREDRGLGHPGVDRDPSGRRCSPSGRRRRRTSRRRCSRPASIVSAVTYVFVSPSSTGATCSPLSVER